MQKYILPFLGLFFLVLGCSKAKDGGSPDYAAPRPSPAFSKSASSSGNLYGNMAQQDRSARFEENIAAETAAVEQDRKIVMTAHVRVRVENLAEADSLITALMEKHGAYASSTVIEENSRRYSIRVPSPVYKAAIGEINGMGRLLDCSESAVDVTLRYYDLEGRLATKKELLKTFQSYLGKAKNIEEILSVEKRIAELQDEIDGTGKALRNLADRVDYATIELSILGPVASLPYRGQTLAERFRELFGNFGKFLSLTAIILVGIVIFGIPILLLLIFFFWLLFGKVGLLKKLWRKAAGGKAGKIDERE